MEQSKKDIIYDKLLLGFTIVLCMVSITITIFGDRIFTKETSDEISFIREEWIQNQDNLPVYSLEEFNKLLTKREDTAQRLLVYDLNTEAFYYIENVEVRP